MTIALHLEPAGRPLPPVEYRWEAETEILSARLRPEDRGGVPPRGGPASTLGRAPLGDTLELAGADGSWIMLDVQAAQLRGLEVAVWPELSTRSGLRPPEAATGARARVAASSLSTPAAPLLVRAESDEPARTLHFRLGRSRVASAVRLADDLLLELDAGGRLAGLWLLNVPPSPTHA